MFNSVKTVEYLHAYLEVYITNISVRKYIYFRNIDIILPFYLDLKLE